MTASPEVHIRVATPADHDEIVALAGAALGWDPAEPNAELFRWKHLDGPLGPSPMWVAEVEDGLGAFRCFLRWELQAPDTRIVRAVRPVDTATRPDLQGQGLFRALTTHAIAHLDEFDELGAPALDTAPAADTSAAGARGGAVAVAFNTPNAQSRPGYLSMGWELVGRVPVAVAVRSPASLARLARARVPAGKWSMPDASGLPAAEVLADEAGVAALLAAQPRSAGWVTHRTPAWLAWRYGAGPMTYRAALRSGRVEDGLVLYRLRRRGAAVEATIGEVLVPGGDPRLARPLLARVLRDAQPDYAIRARSGPSARPVGAPPARPATGPLDRPASRPAAGPSAGPSAHPSPGPLDRQAVRPAGWPAAGSSGRPSAGGLARAVDGRFVALPGQGPRVVWRSLDGAPVPSLADLDLSLGDIESL